MAKKDMYFPIDEYHDRWKRVYAEMKKRGYEVAIVWGKSAGTYERSMDILYLTNFYSTHSGQEPDAPGSTGWNARSFCAAILMNDEPPELHTDLVDPYPERMPTDRHIFALDPIKSLADALNERKIEGPVAWFGSDVLPVKYAMQLWEMTPKIEYVYDNDLMQQIRKLKSPRELDVYREGGEMVTLAVNETMEALIMGKSEAEAAALGAASMIRQGGYFHRIPISHGDATSHLERDPTYGFSQDAPKSGDLIHMALYGPIHQGYWFDPVRTAVGGRNPSPEQKKLVEDLVRIMQEGIEAHIRHGTKVHDVAHSVLDLQAELGYGQTDFNKNWPYFGHGNGCLWEPPFISLECATEDEIFEENMVASSEAFIIGDGVGTAIMENNFIVHKDGIEHLYPKIPMIWW